MAVVRTDDVEAQILHVLSLREEDGWRMAEKYLGIAKETADIEQLLVVFEWIEGRRNYEGIVTTDEVYLSFLVAPTIQLFRWVKDGCIPLGFALGRLTQIGLLIGETAEKLKSERALSDGARSALSENARRAANARHAENREIAERIKAWYRERHERFASLDAAAEAATRTEPVAFRTARKHIGVVAKELRSARKA